MGAGARQYSTTREAFEAEARKQESRRPPTRPRPPPVANNDHTAPLWSEHLQTYVSYSWKEHQWKRWSTTAKLWKVISDIDVVIRAESKFFESAMQGVRTMPPKPQEPGWSDVLWKEAEWVFVSYNSRTGNWKEWSEFSKEWEDARLGDWPEMPVSRTATEEKDEEPLKPKGAENPQKPEGIRSQQTEAPKPPSVLAVRNLLVSIDLAEESKELVAPPSARKMRFESFLKLPYPFNRQKSSVPRKRT